MGRCPNCGFEILEGTTFCVQCGTVIQPFCRQNVYTVPKPKRNTSLLVAVAVTAVIIIVIAANLSVLGHLNTKKSLYAHINIGSINQVATPSPSFMLYFDSNGDGIFETVQNYSVFTTSITPIYLGSSQSVVLKLDSSASSFSYRIQIFNGTSTLSYLSDEAYETFSGPIVERSAGGWNFAPDVMDGHHTHLVTDYSVLALDENNRQT